jgi:hypothetical protein
MENNLICNCHGNKYSSKSALERHVKLYTDPVFKEKERLRDKQRWLVAQGKPCVCPCHNREFPDYFKMKSHIWHYKKKQTDPEGLKKLRANNYLLNAEKERANNYMPSNIYSYTKSNAKRRNIPFDVTIDYFITWYTSQTRECCYCLRSEEECLKDNIGVKRLSIERLDNTKGYIEGNLALACLLCNATKSDLFTEKEMLEIGTVIRRVLRRRK